MTSHNSDFLIIGAGIFGLTIANAILETGATVKIIEAQHVGAGASGGILGALMPHMPNNWNQKKQFQFEALRDLSDFVATLEKETGLATGYRRVGRIMPVVKNGFLKQMQTYAKHAQVNWGSSYDFKLEEMDFFDSWLQSSAENPLLGLLYDTLSARIHPKSYLEALKRKFMSKGGELIVNALVTDIDPNQNFIMLENGEKIGAEKIILTAGVQSFRFLEMLHMPDLGGGVFGQAIKLSSQNDCSKFPIIYDNGCYIIAHDDGTISIGSSSVNIANGDIDPKKDRLLKQDDEKQASLLQQAKCLCPSLESAEIISSWSGVRPKAWARDPLLGYHPNYDNLYVATGGFKIAFGIAHKVADYVVHDLGLALRNETIIPDSFLMNHHLNP